MNSTKNFLLDTFVSDDLRRWLRFQKRKAKRLLSSYEPYVKARSEGGYGYSVYLANPMAEYWYGQQEPGADCPMRTEIAFLQRYALKEGATVFNLGAHHCVVAMLMAKIVGPTGTVVAVEASPENARIGEKSRSINGFGNMHVIQAAISDECGWVDFIPSNLGRVSTNGRGLSSISVPARTVDDLADEYGIPDVLFIDVEGFELHALRGTMNVLETRPDCFIEVHASCGLEEYGSSVEELISTLDEREYNLFYALEGEDTTGTFRPLEWECAPEGRFLLIAIG